VGTLPQDVTFADSSMTAGEVFTAGLAAAGRPHRHSTDPDPGPDPDPVRTLHDLGLLHPRDARQPVGLLSVGQRRRLALAILIAAEPDLLLLDEPTNHISLSLASELEEALRSPAASPGTVIVASHDRWLRSGWDGPVLALDASAPGAGVSRP
jgi:macrolide transport system ATP-binding/permease protein